jgi:hypothetical protein
MPGRRQVVERKPDRVTGRADRSDDRSLTLDGTALPAHLVNGMYSTALPSPLGIALDTPFNLGASDAADLEEGHLIVRYQIV